MKKVEKSVVEDKWLSDEFEIHLAVPAHVRTFLSAHLLSALVDFNIVNKYIIT